MPRSEWICNTCGEGFETKGRRDSHRERTHRQTALIGIEKRGTNRSGNGKFICKCGRDYKRIDDLRRHQKDCKDEILSEGNGNDENTENGTCQFLIYIDDRN